MRCKSFVLRFHAGSNALLAEGSLLSIARSNHLMVFVHSVIPLLEVIRQEAHVLFDNYPARFVHRVRHTTGAASV